MPPASVRRRPVFSPLRLLPVVFLFTLGVGHPAGVANELGRPVFQEFPPGKFKLTYLCQTMIQDGAGFIYLAGYTTLRCYDGSTWHFIKMPGESAGIRRFARTADGTIFAGGASIIGYIRGSGPSAEWVSLADRLPATELGYDEIQDAAALGNAVYFSDEEKILRWHDRKFTVLPFRTPPYSRGARFHRVGDLLYVTAPGRPLIRLAGDRLEEVADDPVFREQRIVSIESGPDETLVLLTADRGFFQFAGGRVTPLALEANRWLAGKRVYRALRLADRSWVVAFDAPSGDCGLRFDAEGRHLGPIDNTIGLYTNTVRDFFADREGGLWLGTEVGAFRLEWPSAVSVFDGINGLGSGSVAALARHDGQLHAATSEGVFRLTPGDATDRVARFERIHGHPAYALAPDPRGLLILGYTSLLLHSPAGPIPIAELPPGGGVLHRSKRDRERIWIGTTNGLRAIRAAPGGWRIEEPLPGFAESVRGIAEASDGTLWISTPARGLFRIEPGDGGNALQIERFADGHGLPGKFERSDTTGWAGEPVFLLNTTARPWRFDSAARKFIPLAHTSTLPDGPFADCWTAGSADHAEAAALWLAGPTGIYRIPRSGGDPRNLPHLVTATVGAVSCLREETGSGGEVLWIGGTRGLVRVEVARAFVDPVHFEAQLSSAELREGSRLPPDHAPLKFDYLAMRHQLAESVNYQTRLVGHDRDWSVWSPKPERVFPHLPPGSYRFEVRARDADHHLSAPASLAFVVLSPWWRTGWAFLGYAVAVSAAIAGVVRLRTRSLRQRAERLERVVADRTAELARSNQELTRLHQLEFDEKVAARLAEEKARLELLRYQLNPHFLFNTLTSISASLSADRSTARTMVERLADFCRLTLHRADDREWTTLGEEMRLLRVYLEIEQSRWGELLDVAIDCPAGLANEQLPYFLLLPLLENALKYGRATSPERVGIRLAASRTADNTLVIEVSNTGEWIEPASSKTVSSLGIGLENLRERLARYYPQSHHLTVAQAEGWVTVTLRLRGRDVT